MSDLSVRAGAISQSAVVTGNGNVVTLTFGDSGVILPLQRPQFRPVERRRGLAAGEPPRDLDLFDPRAGKLPLIGRKEIIAELQAWLDDEVDMSVHALIGRAGTGKTRTALEFCGAVDSDPDGRGPWLAGFVPAGDVCDVVHALATRYVVWKRPTLLVIDNAAQIYEALARWLDRLGYQKLGTKLRILLLDREAPKTFGWWHELTCSAPPSIRDLFYAPRPRSLPDLSDLEERRALIFAAFQAARQARPGALIGLGIPAKGVDEEFDNRLAQPQFGNPLNLVMAGLIALDRGPQEALALRRLDAARRLGRLELDRLTALAKSRKVSDTAMVYIVGFNGLVGGIPIADLRKLVADELAASGRSIVTNLDALLDLLQQELPPRTDTSARPRLATVQPDLIGEAVIIEAFTGAPSREAEAVVAVQRAYGIGRDEAARVLIRLVQDFAYALEDASTTDTERATGRRIMNWLVNLVGEVRYPEHLAPFGWALPQRTTILREPAADLTERLAIFFRQDAERTNEPLAWSRAAALLNNLANRLSDLGRREKALAAAAEAVRLCRALVEAHPGNFTPALAVSLTTLAKNLRELARREEALAAAEEAVGLLRDLAAAHPSFFTPNLALLLNNLAPILSELGRHEEALAAGEEAVRLHRDLAAARPNDFNPALAVSLNNLAPMLSDLGRPEEALAAAAKAVRLLRDLAAARPDDFNPDLVGSLNNLANRLSDLGRREEASAAAAEAVRLCRPLAKQRPDAFTQTLAISLTTFAGSLRELGRSEQALAAAAAAVRLCRTLAEAHPGIFIPNLALSLNNLAPILSELGRREEALAAAAEAVGLYRGLAAARPNAFTVQLAMSMWLIADLYAKTHKPELAMPTAAEAIRLLTPVFAGTPAAVDRVMAGLAKIYLAQCRAAGRQPDTELLAPVIAVFERLNPKE